MIKSRVVITVVNDKGKELYRIEHRKSKAIKIFLVQAIKNKDILKIDVLNIIWDTMQFQNIWDFFKTREKQKKEGDDNGE